MKRFLPLLVALAFALTARAGIPFLEDNFTQALHRAKAKNVPIFVEAWAPWCHTCRSMRAYVYADKGLERYAGRFVWLSINTEEARNAGFLKTYSIPTLPTILILDSGGAVAVRYVGGATVPQVKTLLAEAASRHRTHTQSAASRHLRKADQLAAAGSHAEALRSYEAAIAAAPKGWPRLGRAAESLLFELSLTDDALGCAKRALELYPRVKGRPSAANVASTGLSCATGIDKEDTSRAVLLQSLEKATGEVFDDPKIVLSDDDRSGLYIALIEARDAVGDEEGAVALQCQWAAFLEDAAARAKTAEQRAVYDSHRLSAYLDLGMPGQAVPMLQQSERDFPDDYNPRARLALAYNALKEYDKALAASDRALLRVHGPRRLTVLSARADIFIATGDPKAARETIVAAIAYAKALPEGQRSERRIAALEKRLSSMQD